MSEIYLVTHGRYDDYSVAAVFVDKELAIEHAAQISDKYDTARVEIRSVQTELLAPIGHRGYIVTMTKEGRAEEPEPFGITDFNKDLSTPNYYPAHPDDSGILFFTSGRYDFCVYTDKGPQGAVEIANERRIRMIAENRWPKKGMTEEEYKSQST